MDELSRRFSDFALAFRQGAPLYSRFATRVAREPGILALMRSADPSQRIPVLLFACVHFLLLSRPDSELATQYPNLRERNAQDRRGHDAHGHDVASIHTANSKDVDDLFIRFIADHADELSELLASRSTQTNEIGRCNWFLFPFAMIEDEVGPLARVDVGSSAGLTLLFSDIAFDIRPGEIIGDTSTLTVRLDTRGNPPLLDHVPNVVWSTGFDAKPVDPFDEHDVRWLEACVWPDQVERFDRLVRAIDLARERRIQVHKGDAVADVARFVEEASRHGHPVVTTSWVMNYLSPGQRTAFIDQLDAIGAGMDLTWVIAESPRETPELPVDGRDDEDITAISLVRWRSGQRRSDRLATAHPHGQWVNWTAANREPF